MTSMNFYEKGHNQKFSSHPVTKRFPVHSPGGGACVGRLVPGEALSVRVMRSAVSGVFLLGSWQFNPWFLVVHSVVSGHLLCGSWSFTLWFLVVCFVFLVVRSVVSGPLLCGSWWFAL